MYSTWALLDTGYRTLIRQAQDKKTGEQLTLKCSHGDLRSYPMKIISLTIQGRRFWCRAGIVPQLGAPVLIGWDYPVLMQLMTPQPSTEEAEGTVPILNNEETREKAPPMPVDPSGIIRLIQQDPTLEHACQTAKSPITLVYGFLF